MAQIQVKRGTAAAWTSADTVLSSGEWGYEEDTGKYKIGDGSTAWSSLNYAGSVDRLVIGWTISDGTAGNNIAPELIAPHDGLIRKCKLIVKSSDATTDLEFHINKNGVSVFSANNTVSAGTAAGTLETFTNLTTVPFTVSADDIFTLDIIAGSTDWQFTVQLES